MVAECATRPAFPVAEVTIDEIQARFKSGAYSSREATQAYLDRIEALNHAGPQLNAVIEVNPDALAIAAALDAERKAGKIRGPLHGVPILLKDNIATADRMETTAGSLALVGARPKSDAAVVTRLRAAGAVILGKANLSEWANFRDNKSNSGWSARGGFTRNPYALDRSPSGSSSGSAVSVAANLCVAAIGTETDGSILSPSSRCGIVGLKPTVGLVSRTGIIPIAAAQDTAGPMTLTVRDAAILLGVMAGGDASDRATQEIPAGQSLDYLGGLKTGSLKGARLGLLRPSGEMRPAVKAVFDHAIASLLAAGAVVVDNLSLGDESEISKHEYEVLTHEFKAGLNGYLAALGPGSPLKSLADIIAFNTAHASTELRYFGQKTFIDAEEKGPLTDPIYLKAKRESRWLSRERIDALLNGQHLDALVALSNGPAGLIDVVNGDYFSGGTSTLAAVAGYPALTVPAGQVRELPIGLTFVGRAWSEARLLSLAAEFERWTHSRQPPQFRPTIGVD
ncbi:MAG: gatA 1 [Verrucomicrobia bacterium]|nr:gatA 1 [Verrucomicrobiota bacterium]